MCARILCRRILNTKPTKTKRPTLQNLKKQITYISCSRKRIIREAKFHSQNFAGWARILLRKRYRTTIIWYEKLALTRRKCFTECECVSSHPANHQPIYASTRTNTNLIPKSALITTICMRGRGNIIMNSQFSTLKTIIRCRPTNQKFQYSLTCQREKSGTHKEPHTSVPQKFLPQ